MSRLFTIAILFLGFAGFAQSIRFKDAINQENLPGVSVYHNDQLIGISNEKGEIALKRQFIDQEVFVFLSGYKQQQFVLSKGQQEIQLHGFFETLDQVEIKAKKSNSFGFMALKPVEKVYVYSGKKSEVILPAKLPANKATNNARQVFAKVSGLNIWESDCAGLQLGIGGRGLSPNRSTHFNTRQNHYDISADALGYPESYYSPPVQAIYRVEVVRGAAGLQYGPQLGGLVNFILKDDQQTQQGNGSVQITGGSNQFLNLFADYGKKSGKWMYYAYLQRKSGNCFRPNSAFNLLGGHAYLKYNWSNNGGVSVEVTAMDYLTQQAGGLTDRQFELDPYTSTRERNWFRVNWNLFALKIDQNWSSGWRFSSNNFGLVADRTSLGFLGPIHRPDPNAERDIIDGTFKNIGSENRFLKTYFIGTAPSSLAFGFRLYRGTSEAYQGLAPAGKDAKFERLDNGLKSDYRYPNNNASLFLENVFSVNKKLKITPGARFEYINTQADGEIRNVVTDGIGDTILDQTIPDALRNERTVLLGGIGFSYAYSKDLKFYANASTNYRPVNFTDLKIVNPSFAVDPNLEDERGYNIDFGIKLDREDDLAMDLSFFYLGYRNRIGEIHKVQEGTGQLIRYRTNVSQSRNTGIESYIEKVVYQGTHSRLSAFQNTAYINAIYLGDDESILDGNQVELVPKWNIKTGASYYYKKWAFSGQFGYVSQQFSDASNAVETPSAIFGEIPAYSILDFTVQFKSKNWTVSTNIDNALNAAYFTRRATAYPGPGIIPSAPRQVYLTLSYTF